MRSDLGRVFRNVISGTDRRAGAAALRGLLWACSWFYRSGVAARSAAYRIGIARVHHATVPVISVGNVTAGGTGKTPFVAWLAQRCHKREVKICFLSRGYGAAPGLPNDEARVLAQLCPDVPHLQDPDRVKSSRVAVEQHQAQALVLDDGFQHRRLARDLDIVLVDAVNPWGFGYLLPRGLLREPLSALRRAHAVVITRVDLAAPEAVAAIREQVASLNPRAIVAEAVFTPLQFVNAQGRTCPLDALRGKPVFAFCGIGNPEAFRQTLLGVGMQVAGHRDFPDHYAYGPPDLEAVRLAAESCGAAAILTTQKDLVKIELAEIGAIPLWGVQIVTNVVAGEQQLDREIERVLRMARRS